MQNITICSPTADRSCRAGEFTSRLTSKWLVTVSIAMLAMVVLAAPASAQNCLQNEYNIFNGAAPDSTAGSLGLVCTANDVRVAKVANVRDLNGAPLTTCIAGSTFSFLADFEVVTSSTSSRSNIGLYFATQNQANALSGSCVDNIISPKHQCPGAAAGIQCGSDNYHELDPQVNSKGGAVPDSCGDTSSTDRSLTFGNAAEDVTIVVNNFLCQAPAGSTTLQLPNCTSWQIPGGTNVCFSPSPDYPYENAAVPGTKSKCNCGTIPLPITPVTPSAKTGKACNTTATSMTPTFDFTSNTGQGSPSTCDAGPEGGTATYTVEIANTTNVGAIHIDQICDSVYGTIYDDNLLNSSNTRVFAACSAGTTLLHGAQNLSCPPADIAQGATSAPCQFTAPIGEIANVTDIVTSSGHSVVSTGQTFTNSQSNSVTVTSTDAPSTATVAKGFVGTEAQLFDTA
jgi:hypothetical protein